MSEILVNKLSSLTGTDSDITIDPDGTGDTVIASGNLGIGTTAPSQKLTVEGTANNQNSEIKITASGVASGYLGSNSNGLNIGTDSHNIVFKTGVTGGGSVGATGSERLRVTSAGDVAIGKTSNAFGTQGFFFAVSPGQLSITCNQNSPLRLNRVNNDGTVVSIQGDSSEEGTISISGGTVSYNGGHLSRWSHLPDGEKDDTILKGTVLTNLDDMCHWVDADGNVKAKEQLNQVQISSVEGDKNVAGVMVNWCDGDEAQYPNTIDLNMAMTGDMVIRIAEGTTVIKGDLLMSAGDGTAKPQDDDIVRSKTIAKVTSATVSKTYDDGTYLVPCVVMAC